MLPPTSSLQLLFSSPATNSCTEPQPFTCYLDAAVAKDGRRKAWKFTRALRAPDITSSLVTILSCLFVPCTMTLSKCGVKHYCQRSTTISNVPQAFLCLNAQRKTPTHLLRFPRRRQWPLFGNFFVYISFHNATQLPNNSINSAAITVVEFLSSSPGLSKEDHIKTEKLFARESSLRPRTSQLH